MPAHRLSLFLVLITLALTSCQPDRSALSLARGAAQDSLRADSITAARETADSLARIHRMTDGEQVAMPLDAQKALIANDSLWKKALRIHYNAIVMDGHMDTPTLMQDEGYQFTKRHSENESHVDLPRMEEGGLDGSFFSVYVAAGYGEGAPAQARARDLIHTIKRQVGQAESAHMAYTAADVRRLAKSGQKAILMGLEGGHALGASVDTLKDLYEAGIRYVTLTHVNTNSWADASQSPPRHGGLNDKGRQLVRAMNRLGVLVDCAHVSDSTFYDAVEVSKAPVIFSHSSDRALVDNVRNVSDDMLRALKKNDGVIMINFYDPMINHHMDEEFMNEVYARIDKLGIPMRQLWYVIFDVKRERNLPGATIDDLIDHIDHAVQVAGIDHVGLGSDFDGVGDLPAEVQDVSEIPWITYGLLKRGYSEKDIYKILGGNTLRVLEDAERIAADSSSTIE